MILIGTGPYNCIIEKDIFNKTDNIYIFYLSTLIGRPELKLQKKNENTGLIINTKIDGYIFKDFDNFYAYNPCYILYGKQQTISNLFENINIIKLEKEQYTIIDKKEYMIDFIDGNESGDINDWYERNSFLKIPEENYVIHSAEYLHKQENYKRFFKSI